MRKSLEVLSKDELIDLIIKSKNETIKYVNKFLEEEEKQDVLRIVLLKLSHEFKTPLNSIIGFSDILKNRATSIEDYKCLNNINSSSRHLLSLIKDLLDVTRSQYKPLELIKTRFNSAEIIRQIISEFGLKNINYTLSEVEINADETRFKQIIYNLISNAIKFSNPDDEVKIFSYVENSKFCFEIVDLGEGINDDDKNIIFDFFSQASNDVKKRQFGCGIGLSLCKSIVEAHGGNIFVKNNIPKGSIFMFSIPLIG